MLTKRPRKYAHLPSAGEVCHSAESFREHLGKFPCQILVPCEIIKGRLSVEVVHNGCPDSLMAGGVTCWTL